MEEGMLLTLILTLNQAAAAAAQADITMADLEASFCSSRAYIAAQYVDENINANAILWVRPSRLKQSDKKNFPYCSSRYMCRVYLPYIIDDALVQSEAVFVLV